MNRFPPIHELFGLLQRIGEGDLPDEQTPLGRITREFFQSNWENCRDGLLDRTNRIRVAPEPALAPRLFRFEVDVSYKQKRAPDAVVTLAPGPIIGMVIYRPDLFANIQQPAIAVRLDRGQDFFHPNYSRRHRLLCLGNLPPGPFPLDTLLENHLFPILSYQNHVVSDPVDVDAARYFALDSDAMRGLEGVQPLY